MKQPNILIFMTDHQRADTVLKEHVTIAPNLEKLAQEGVTFTENYCPSPHCCPARATFMTGLYPTRHGVWNNICNDQALSRGLKEGVRCWSEDLADAGYKLAYTGKWHVSTTETPGDRGFEELQSFKGGNIHGWTWDRIEAWKDTLESAEREEGQILRPGWPNYQTYGTNQRSGDEDIVARGIEKLPELAAGDEPWALFIGCNMPHDTYHVPQKYLDMYNLDDIQLPASYYEDVTTKPQVVQRMRRQTWDQLSEREARETMRHFYAMCTYLDDLFGQVLEVLEKTGQADDTLVLYCADHGDYCGDHGLFCKGIPCYRGAYNVPAVMRWPNGISNPGRRVDDFVSLADFAPTFTELSGRSPDLGLTGKSLVPFLKDEQPEQWRDEMHTQCNGVEIYFSQRSVSTKEWKYVFNGFDKDELYNLQDDPDEMVNLIDRADLDDVVKDMCKRMWKFAHEQEDGMKNPYITVGLAPYGPGIAYA